MRLSIKLRFRLVVEFRLGCVLLLRLGLWRPYIEGLCFRLGLGLILGIGLGLRLEFRIELGLLGLRLVIQLELGLLLGLEQGLRVGIVLELVLGFLWWIKLTKEDPSVSNLSIPGGSKCL